MRLGSWGVVALLVSTSGCFSFEKDYRVRHAGAEGWIPGLYNYDKVAHALESLGFTISHAEKPILMASNDTVQLEASRTTGLQARFHPDTWTLVGNYQWREEFGERSWHDSRLQAQRQGEALWQEARWGFDALLRDISPYGDGQWNGTHDREVKLVYETRDNYLRPRS